jgi:hypothetical protein
MTADEFVQTVRKGSEKLRIDEVIINTGSKELRGKGILQISHKKISVNVTLEEGGQLPQMSTGIYTKKDSWKITGLIEDTLRFKCENVGPIASTQLAWQSGMPNRITRCTFTLHPMDLIPAGWDAATREQRKGFLEQNQMPTTGYGVDETKDNALFYATLLEYPLNTSSWGKEIKGETENFDFILTKPDKNSDLQISFESKKKSALLKAKKKTGKNFITF